MHGSMTARLALQTSNCCAVGISSDVQLPSKKKSYHIEACNGAAVLASSKIKRLELVYLKIGWANKYNTRIYPEVGAA